MLPPEFRRKRAGPRETVATRVKGYFKARRQRNTSYASRQRAVDSLRARCVDDEVFHKYLRRFSKAPTLTLSAFLGLVSQDPEVLKEIGIGPQHRLFLGLILSAVSLERLPGTDYRGRYAGLFVRQDHLARAIGCHVRHIRRMAKDLHALGLVNAIGTIRDEPVERDGRVIEDGRDRTIYCLGGVALELAHRLGGWLPGDAAQLESTDHLLEVCQGKRRSPRRRARALGRAQRLTEHLSSVRTRAPMIPEKRGIIKRRRPVGNLRETCPETLRAAAGRAAAYLTGRLVQLHPHPVRIHRASQASAPPRPQPPTPPADQDTAANGSLTRAELRVCADHVLALLDDAKAAGLPLCLAEEPSPDA